jgi:hypothetical protein
MAVSSIWTLVAIGVAVAALVGLGVLTRSEMRRGQTPPGPPADLETGTHDEPVEDVARILDAKRHVHTSEDVSKAARDQDRMLGH